MIKSGLTLQKITQDTNYSELTDITSLTVSNMGASNLTLTVNDVPVLIPAFDPAFKVPFGSFNLPGDGTACAVRLAFSFNGGTGHAVLHYRKLLINTNTCNNG